MKDRDLWSTLLIYFTTTPERNSAIAKRARETNKTRSREAIVEQ